MGLMGLRYPFFFSFFYLVRMMTEKKILMGSRGITVLQSSGDFGVGGGCLSTNGRNKTRFEPMFPVPVLTSSPSGAP